jgi:hypothetical protein
MYEPVIGRWIVPDPIRQYFSPYLAMGNNPVNGVDPDGGLIIFINGLNGENLGLGTNDKGKPFWNSWNFIEPFNKIFDESPNTNLFADGMGDTRPEIRKINGYAWANQNIKAIKAEYIKTGRIVLVSHSMGYAFAQGVEARLKEEEGINPHAVFQIAIAPYNYSRLNAGSIPTAVFVNEGDWVSGWKLDLQGDLVEMFRGKGWHLPGDFRWIFKNFKSYNDGTVEVGKIRILDVINDD